MIMVTYNSPKEIKIMEGAESRRRHLDIERIGREEEIVFLVGDQPLEAVGTLQYLS